MTIAEIEARLSAESEKLERLTTRAEAAHRASDAATPAGLHGDPAVLSGITRSHRRGARMQERRFAAYDREATAARELREQERKVTRLERALDRAKVDAAAPCDLDAVRKGWLIRDRHGWHRVARVNAKTFSVATAYSWTDRIDRSKVIETHGPLHQDVAS